MGRTFGVYIREVSWMVGRTFGVYRHEVSWVVGCFFLVCSDMK